MTHKISSEIKRGIHDLKQHLYFMLVLTIIFATSDNFHLISLSVPGLMRLGVLHKNIPHRQPINVLVM